MVGGLESVVLQVHELMEDNYPKELKRLYQPVHYGPRVRRS